MARKFAFLAALLATIFVATLSILPAKAETFIQIGTSEKICQLTGQTDWATNAPTAAKTQTNFGLISDDLGFPVESGKELYFLFGDAFPITHPPFGTIPPDDSLGWTTRTTAPDPKTCLDLQLATSAPQTFAHPTVTPPIQQGSFNVPTGGVFVDSALYGFFWTNHCALPAALTPMPATPLVYPSPPPPTCAEIPLNNSVGVSVIARATPADPTAFQQTIPYTPQTLQIAMPNGFVYVSAAQPRPHYANEPKIEEISIPVYGAPRYRASVPYLAMAPRKTFGDPATWSFYAGMMGGNPVWIDYWKWVHHFNASGQWMPPGPDAQIFHPGSVAEECVAEHSVTWNAPLRSWLLLYNCSAGQVEARIAPDPWGPWSKPITLIAPGDPGVPCKLVQSAAGCTGLVNYWTLPNSTNPWPGFFYAPFVMDRYTENVPQSTPLLRRATVYWLVSTWNPYQVSVMRSTIEIRD